MIYRAAYKQDYGAPIAPRFVRAIVIGAIVAAGLAAYAAGLLG